MRRVKGFGVPECQVPAGGDNRGQFLRGDLAGAVYPNDWKDKYQGI